MYFDINWRNNKSPNLTAKNLNRMQEIAEELYNEAVYQKQSGENALIIRKNIDPNFIEPWEIFYMDGNPIVLEAAVGKSFLAFVEDPNGKLCYKTNGVEFRFRTVSREEAIYMLNSGTEDGGEDSGSSGGGSGGSEDDKPTITTYTITYMTNGGSEIDQQTVAAGSIITDTPSTTTREGYEFIGWYYDENLTEEVVFPYKVMGNSIFYAKWKQVENVIITFITNCDLVLASKTVQVGTMIDLDTLIRTGYTFDGWYSDQEFNTKVESPITAIENITLYAKWTALPTYTITYIVNGGTELEPLTVYSGTYVNLGIPTKDYYVFEGWYLEENLTTKITSPYEVTSDMTLYAKYTLATYSITFVVNGGVEIDKVYGNIETPITLPTTTKDGYIFGGWYMNEDLTTQVEDPITLKENITVYAKWTEVQKHTVTFITNGGSSVEDVRVEPGTRITLPTPTRTDYNFMGWYYNSSFTNEAESPLVVSKDITLYAKWEAIVYYTITFISNGGTEYENIVAVENTVVNLPDPTKLNCQFRGWYLDSGFNNVVKSPITLTKNITLYAKWEQVAANAISNLTVQYIKDEQWGNTIAEKWANWSEIMAMKDGVNVAQGCPVLQSWDGITYENSIYTDGKIDEHWGIETSGDKNNPGAITVMLREPVNLDSVIVCRPHASQGIKYYNRVLVSADEVNWYVLYDSDIDGVYTESTTGREFTTYYTE